MTRAAAPVAARTRGLRRFAGDAAGVAVIEFAFIAPILIFFYFGMAETCQLIMAQRRVSHASAALTDLVTQDTEIGEEEMKQLYEAACVIMKPFQSRSVRIRVTSASRRAAGSGAGSIMVDWSTDNGTRNGGRLTQFAADTDLSTGTPATVETPLGAVGESIVFAEVEYDMVSPIGYFLPSATTLKHKSEMRPRKVQKVAYPVGTLTPPPTAKICST